jgi:O-succinylbenzoic acid--CoA ligase
VAVALPPSLEFAALLHAMPLLGSVLVPLNTRDPAHQPAYDLLVDAPLEGPEADVEPRSPGPDETWVILHTSGTTAAPKPVELTYGNFRASAQAAAANLPLTPDDRWLCVLPLFHVGGLSILTRSAFAGSTAIVHERFDVDAVAESLESGEATVVSLVGTMLRRLQQRGLSGAPALRAALVGGGPVPRDLLDWGRSIGLPLLLTYGMTETCSQIATAVPGDDRGLVKPLPGVELKIAPGAGGDAKPGDAGWGGDAGRGGEILIRGPMVSRGALAADGWLHSGDRGRLDAEGYLWVDGRIKDTIVSGGENVAAAEVEEALLAHPAVADAAVVGRPDAEWGEAVTAFVVLASAASHRDAARSGPTPTDAATGSAPSGSARSDAAPAGQDPTDAALIAHCRQRLAGYKVPRAIVRVDELPRTASGKLLKGLLTR